MANCGCDLQNYRCLAGLKLMMLVTGLYEAINSAFFLTLSQTQKEHIFKEYDNAVDAYYCHLRYDVEKYR